MAKNPLTRRQKIHKWFRLVALLTLRRYGYWILGQLYYSFLVGAVIGSMHKIWTQFSESQTCHDDFVSLMTIRVSEAYDDAAKAFAKSALNNTQCIMEQVDVPVPRPLPDVPLSSLPESVKLRLFGWIDSPDTGVPAVRLDVNSSAGQVVKDINHDIHRMHDYSKWADYVGLVLAGCTILLILGTATYYTSVGKPWRPSKGRWFMNILSLVRIFLFYFVAMLFVYMQAYAVEQACGIQVEGVDLTVPECTVFRECRLNCTLVLKAVSNPCTACEIGPNGWWVHWDSLPNVFGFLYIAFLLMVWILESIETRYQINQAHKVADGGYSLIGDGLLRKGTRRSQPKSTYLKGARYDPV